MVHKHQVDNNPVEYLTQNKYNELSQLESKKVGGIAAASPLQQIDYRYNIRGWMTKINDPVNLNGKLFGYEIRYHNPVNTQVVGRYNGNIAEIDWNNGSENLLKRYDYEYDKVNRLTKAFYKEPSTAISGTFDEYLTYDLNGNISTLKRWAVPVNTLTSTIVDDLSYQYTGNRLDKVIEYAMNDTGYEGGNNTIDDNLNGSMINMKDKGINTITYNYLNLPESYSITQTNPVGGSASFELAYLYRADGTKVRKTYKSGGNKGNTKITTNITDYLDGFQYKYSEITECLWCRTSVAFEEQAFKGEKGVDLIKPLEPKWRLDFVPTAEGFYSFTENRYIYQYKDHLGNTRVNYAKNSAGALEITDTNNYYPFGMNHIGGIKSQLGGYLNYKYNGKELQETGMYDYGWRSYMPDVGRWMQLDPLVENTDDPYAYVYNNPISLTDPDGRAPDDGGDDDCCNEFFTGVKEGFVGTFKGIGNFITHPIDGTKNAINNYTWSDYGDSVANSMTFGIYGTAKTAGALMQGDSKTAGKTAGEKVAEVIIVAATDGLGRGIKGIRNAKDPGLGNQFKAKTTSQVNNAMEKQVNKGKLDKVYTDPKSGSTSYKNKKSGYSYNVDTGKSGKTGKKVEPTHIDVNYPNPKPKNMPPKKKLPTKED